MEFSNFLLPMLKWKPENRATAQILLSHPWLKKACRSDYLMSEEEYNVTMQNLQIDEDNAVKEPADEMCLSDDEQNNADSERTDDEMEDEGEDKDTSDNPRDFLLYNDHGPNKQFAKPAN